MRLDQGVALGVGLEVIDRLDKGDAGPRGQDFAHAVAKFGMRVHARANSRAADWQL